MELLFRAWSVLRPRERKSSSMERRLARRAQLAQTEDLGIDFQSIYRRRIHFVSRIRPFLSSIILPTLWIALVGVIAVAFVAGLRLAIAEGFTAVVGGALSIILLGYLDLLLPALALQLVYRLAVSRLLSTASWPPRLLGQSLVCLLLMLCGLSIWIILDIVTYYHDLQALNLDNALAAYRADFAGYMPGAIAMALVTPILGRQR